MGSCSSKNDSKLDIDDILDEDLLIPEKQELPKIYLSTNTVFFKNEVMTAYKAKISKSETEVVIKKMTKIELNKQLIMREITALNKLQHPNIMKCIEYFQTKNAYFVIYPFFPGRPILQYLQANTKKRNISFIKSFIQQLLKVINVMHESYIAHRGIDDSKIIFDGQQLLLTGFNNALFLDSQYFKKHQTFPKLLSTMKTVYWPPELNNINNDHKVDIWCVGILVYIMITGKYPFEFDELNTQELRYDKFNEERLQKMKIPKEVTMFIKLCLTQDYKVRPTAQDLLKQPWFKKGSIDQFNIQEIEIDVDYDAVIKENELIKNLKQLIVNKIMSTEEKKQINNLFLEYDLDNNGSLDKKEFIQAMKRLNSELTEEQIMNMFQKMDNNRNGVIEYDEFIEGLSQNKVLYKQNTIEQLIILFDLEKFENVSKKDFLEKLKSFGNQKEVKKMAQKIFQTSNGLKTSVFKKRFANCIEEFVKENQFILIITFQKYFEFLI